MRQRLLNLFQQLTLARIFGITLGTAVVILAVGTTVTGSMEAFIDWMASISTVLLVVRLTVYTVAAYIGFKAYRLNRKLEDQDGARRVARLLILGAVLVAAVEIPKVL